MSKITAADFRSWETKALADGVITSQEAKDLKGLVGAEKLDAGDKAVLKEILQHDRFESKGAKTAVAALGGFKTVESSPVLGKEVAKGVFVQQSFSPVNGHRTKEQALAAARMADADNAVAVKDKSGRWHAVAATKPVSEKDAMAGVATLHDCPPAAFKSLYDRAQAATGDERKQLFTKLAAITYGVPEGDINVMTAGSKPVPGKINVNLDPKMQAAGKITSGCDCGASHENFKPGSDLYAVQVRADQLADPRKAAGVMFHELSHADDYLQAQKVFAAYQKAEPAKAAALAAADFSDRSAGLSPAAVRAESDFQVWINTTSDKTVKGLSQAEKDKAQGYLTGKPGPTEASAYTKSFIQEFRATVKELDGVAVPTEPKAKLEYWDRLGGQLMTYANGQQGGRVPKSEAPMTEVVKELRAFYATLTPAEQGRFQEVMKHIKATCPRSQVVDFVIP